MTWFSSGLSNLKEQITSLINDDDEYHNGESHISSGSTSCSANIESVMRAHDFSSSGETSERLDGSRPPFSTHYTSENRQRVLQYGKALDDVLSDVSVLNACLGDMSDGIETCIDNENGRWRNDAEIALSATTTAERSDDGGTIVPLISDVIRNASNAISAPLDDFEIRDRYDESKSSTKDTIDAKGVDDGNAKVDVDDVVNDEPDQRRSPLSANITVQQQHHHHHHHHRNDNAVTEQIENLIIEIDEITEQLSSVDRSWQKTANDGCSLAVSTQLLLDYTKLTLQRNVLWEKLKVSFLWPTVAKCKNAKISELSVPDSIKEVFLPGFVAHSNQFAREVPQQDDDCCSITTLEKSNDRESTSLSSVEAAPLAPSPYAAADHGDTLNSCSTVVTKSDGVGSVEFAEITNSMAVATNAAEVERLRKHLISVEQAYTNELLQCEQEIQILRNELKTREEKLESIAESYTCMNLTTNKTIEKLQSEVKQLTDERAQLTTQLCCCRNDLERAMVDTRNLRSALDFVHKNKDDEVCQATENLKHQIRALRSDNERLRETINSLQNDLDSCQQVSNRLESLSDELKSKNDEITTLKAKVGELLERHGNFEPSTSPSSSDSTFAAVAESKVQIYLTSNSPATKAQSLRILADVLEFSDDEKSRIRIGGHSCDKANNNQSLIGEFIRFVENESHPRSSDSRPVAHRSAAMQIEPSAAVVCKSYDLPPSTTTTRSRDLAVASLACSSSSILKDALNSNDL